VDILIFGELNGSPVEWWELVENRLLWTSGHFADCKRWWELVENRLLWTSGHFKPGKLTWLFGCSEGITSLNRLYGFTNVPEASFKAITLKIVGYREMISW